MRGRCWVVLHRRPTVSLRRGRPQEPTPERSARRTTRPPAPTNCPKTVQLHVVLRTCPARHQSPLQSFGFSPAVLTLQINYSAYAFSCVPEPFTISHLDSFRCLSRHGTTGSPTIILTDFKAHTQKTIQPKQASHEHLFAMALVYQTPVCPSPDTWIRWLIVANSRAITN